ncbi:MAG: hypothetical protein WAN66_13230 [Limnoraphis robusta]|uniref:hypothetical protein n=1 Tax=Limnoraphis robusta TaxID=1118279 RepID=UPI002B213819|nr:hypothetical protein [Limnoraphis robusta]MEA5495817.1 hypothetical protein [Limnoraphis robusta BA-68 BA1]MEA5538523.1 hypothetical protein [Limnoraphis robusta Tam1]
MSKLTETLQSQLPENLKNVSIKFDADLLDEDLRNKLAIYLSTKESSVKLVEMSFAITSAKKLDPQRSFIEQIQLKPAKKLIDIVSQTPQDNTEKKMQQASVPRWMVLLIGSDIDSINGKTPVTVEDAINIVFRLCLDIIGKSLGNDGQTTKKVG